MTTATPKPPTRDLVRREVHALLDRANVFHELPADKRNELSSAMVDIGEYLTSDPGWLESDDPAESEGVSEALGPVDELKDRLAQAPGQVGDGFVAGGGREGTDQFRQLVAAVDFPDFVASLIQGVFQAIVDASIQQMEAYGELLAATAKTVDEFANDHISDDQAREQVAARFPSVVRAVRSTDSGGTRLELTGEADDKGKEAERPLQQFAKTNEVIDFTDPEAEQKFVTAAKLEMARQRQKLMALMVMLGINRIIVTNGRINAKVLFDMRSTDYARREASASLEDRAEAESGGIHGYSAPWGGGGVYHKNKHMTTVKSSIDDTSESKAELNAQLSGDVRVNFRSETLPPERMLEALGFEEQNYLTGISGPSQAGRQQPGTKISTGGAA